MTAWTNDELGKIASAEELEIATATPDGTLRNPVTIWVVRHGDDLYVRSWHGPTGSWFRSVQDSHEGHIRAGGIDKDVVFVHVHVDDDVNDAIDNAYRTKYHRYTDSYVPPMIRPDARATTLMLVPRS